MIQTFLTLVAWLAAILATITTIRRLNLQGEYLMRGQKREVPCMWPAMIAAVAWLWLIAGWIVS